MSASQALAVVGGLVAAKATFDLLNFVYFHTRPSRVTRYLHGKAPYALVTGATDGIGKSTAKELYRRGFNLIIHGRNAEKLERVRKEILAVGGAGKDVKVWVADAGSSDVDFEGAVKSWDGLEITLVLHNVGGAPSRGVHIDEIPADALLGDLRRNAIFPMLLTRALLPKLRRVPGPVEMAYIGSLSSNFPSATLIPYGATKAFLRQFSGSVEWDELFPNGGPSNLSTIYLDVGSVKSASHKIDASFGSPDADKFAKSIVQCLGSGVDAVVPYWVHAIQIKLVTAIPESMLKQSVFEAMKHELIIAKRD